MWARTRRSFLLTALAMIPTACGAGRPPAGQLPLVTITGATLETLRSDFNAAGDEVRVILLLSPT